MSSYGALVFLATAWTLTSWLFLVDSNLFSQRERFQESDFIMTFYVAGHLVAEGKSDELYPDAERQSFVNTPFDRAAHALLPHLPKATTGAYMNIPLVAAFFAPFSYVSPNLALFLWQALSILALGLCSQILARITGIKASELFFLSFLYSPVFLTLWAGQLGLVFGLVPLCLGYLLLLKQQPLATGFVWSLLILKPQYLPVAGLVAIVSALFRSHRILIGLILGVSFLIALTVALFSLPITLQWLVSHQVSEAYFFSGLQGIPAHLLTGLPANILVLLPVDLRSSVKPLLYASAATLWLLGLWYCSPFNKYRPLESAPTTLAFVIGLLLTSLTSPHLLYYDLCILVPAGALLIAKRGPFSGQKSSRAIAIAGWIIIAGFLPVLLVFSQQKIPSLVLEIILLALFSLLILRWSQLRSSFTRAL